MVGESGLHPVRGSASIAIARALITNPAILIFDEAHECARYESERIIQENMSAMCRAGRSSSSPTASAVRLPRIVVMDGGGSMKAAADELIGNGGCYARLHSHQCHVTPLKPAAQGQGEPFFRFVRKGELDSGGQAREEEG